MPATKLKLIGAFAMLLSLALAVSCKGFFVNPTVTSLAIGPANVSLAPSTTFHMVATATFSDGSTSDVTGKSVWTSASANVATFTSPGVIQAAALSNLPTLPATTSVSASDGTVSSSSQTVTVCPVVETLTLTVNGGASVSVAGGTALMFDAEGTFNGVTGNNSVDAYVTWNISNTSALASIDTSGNGTALSGHPGTFTVSATLCGVTSKTVSITTTS
jgi:trimeric autotransporter adhesin